MYAEVIIRYLTIFFLSKIVAIDVIRDSKEIYT